MEGSPLGAAHTREACHDHPEIHAEICPIHFQRQSSPSDERVRVGSRPNSGTSRTCSCPSGTCRDHADADSTCSSSTNGTCRKGCNAWLGIGIGIGCCGCTQG